MQNKLINILYKITTGAQKIKIVLAPLGGLFFLAFLMLFILTSFKMDRLLMFPKIFSVPINVIVSIPIIIIGLFLILWSVLHFLKAKGTPVPFNPPPKLVIKGPYAYIRNPMILGVYILLVGIGALFNSFCLIFIFTPLFILIGTLFLKLIEEPELEKRLGQEYAEYKKRTPMFIPRLKI